MADILNAVREVYQRFGRDHPMLSHLAGIPEETYLRNRPHFDARTATKWALAKTSYPQLARPVTHQGPAPLMTAIGAQGGSSPSPGSDIPSWPTAWDAARHPAQSYERYIASWRKQFPRYLHDPIGAAKADFQSYRSNGRVLDLVGARAEEAAADAPVIAAKAADIALSHLPVIPRALGGPDLDSPTLTPGRRKFAPAVEAAMLPLKQDAALRPPTNYWERSVAGTTDAAMLLSAPVGAGAEIAGEARGVQQGLGAAAAEFRTLLARAKSWDEAFAALSARSKTILTQFWHRYGRGFTTAEERSAAWGSPRPAAGRSEIPKVEPEAKATLPSGSIEPTDASELSDSVDGPKTSAYREGSFSIVDWSGYPAGPRPAGPFRLLEGDEYQVARRAANKANRSMHRVDPSLADKEVHEIQPVKFGGHPADPDNKIPLHPAEHSEFTTWWKQLQRDLEGEKP